MGENNDPNGIPVLFVKGENVPDAWEKALLAVYDNGAKIKTEYDRESDPPSLDATVTVIVEKPLAEPRIHKNFPGGPTELETYRQEVLLGIHDHWIDPKAGKWTYTYHQRLFAYQACEDLTDPEKSSPFDPVDQIAWMVEKLADIPYSRRAQGTTWIPHADPATDDPPCLQRLWARLLPAEDDGWVLSFNSHWRSRDLYKAWFMNVFAITDLQRQIAERLQEKLGEPVSCGRYVDISDSLHIYGSYQDEELETEIKKMRSGPYTERAWETSRLAPIFEEVREKLAEDPDYYSKGNM
ncbi:MAG: hypothetical protein KGZ25_03050 [Planctomycetes bacterium]|nr:hypothetical protein [Planctomycetota bacterium]